VNVIKSKKKSIGMRVEKKKMRGLLCNSKDWEYIREKKDRGEADGMTSWMIRKYKNDV